MGRVTYYMAKKRIKAFINSCEGLFQTKKHFIKEIDIALADLNSYPEMNKNQINFYNKIKEHLIKN